MAWSKRRRRSKGRGGVTGASGVHVALVRRQVVFGAEALGAELAHPRPVGAVRLAVFGQAGGRGEGLAALVAAVGPLLAVEGRVPLQVRLVDEALQADVAHVRPSVRVVARLVQLTVDQCCGVNRESTWKGIGLGRFRVLKVTTPKSCP